ncbi:MAG: fatty acid desaturase [Bacteroidetes bacterium]|nr:fatty acid desaturase [Bacteroidota bacterium]
MRTGKELIAHSKSFSKEDRLKSWFELWITIFLIIACITVGLTNEILLPIKIIASLLCGLAYVRLFVIYHDYAHRAILQNSKMANVLMTFVGIYMLAPKTIWSRTHEHHHNNNSKLTLSGIGSYPTVSKKYFLKLNRKKRLIYLLNRHPLTILLGYFTLFIFWLNLKSFFESPRKHFDSLAALLFHFGASWVTIHFFGWPTYFLSFFFPFFLAFAMGAYLFYCQHNFPGAEFKENHDWTYDNAALTSTSYMTMNPVMNWFTGNIGYHHVHHLNSRIPFYRLKEALATMPELHQVKTTSWYPKEILGCLRLKLWDPETNRMITLKQFRSEHPVLN